MMDRSADPTPAFLHSRRPALAHEDVSRVLAAHWAIRGDVADAGGDRDQNLAVTASDGTRYLVKIGQATEDRGVLEMQLAALRHARRQDPGLGVPDVIATRGGDPMRGIPAPGGGEHPLRVFAWMPGRPISGHPRPPALMRSIGDTLARVDRALRGFTHPRAAHRLLWDVREAPSLRTCADDIADPAARDRVLRVVDDFVESVLPRLDGLRSQVIHGDPTADNVLARDDAAAVTGLIDFGDAVHAPLAQELAVAMADTPYGLARPWAAACQLAAGFDERLPLESEEALLLWDLARARIALTAAVLATRAARRPEGVGSMAGIVAECWRQLDALEGLGRAAALRALRQTLRLPESFACAAGVAAPDEALLLARRERLAPGLALFYPPEPLHAARGEGMWLIDASGRRCLDCYNNVPHVGHCHPHVVNAVARQSAALNTNTRYLYDSIVEYAARLAELLPGELGVCLFVNSGSEANDLAWRIATAVTGRGGMLVTAGAYHGITAATAALSPYAGDAAELPGHVRTLRPPPGGGADEAGQAIRSLDAAGVGVAGCIVDPTLASDGILDVPAGYLAGVFRQVRAAGGLCIADEVQAGFGRLGTRWGFEAHDAVPDIVTLGKPAANGYPLGAVITTPRIARAFTARHDCFSTFGGNPVACTAGLAVLDVIEREGLRERAADVGAYLRGHLARLAQRHAGIGAVRGRGLFLGVELVAGDGTAAAATAERVALALRRDAILVGIEGPGANVLKVRPPLVCERAHADRLVAGLERALAGATNVASKYS